MSTTCTCSQFLWRLVVVLFLMPTFVFAQNDRSLANCENLAQQERAVCETKNMAVNFCQPEKDPQRFSVCVESVKRNPPKSRPPQAIRATDK